MYPNDTTQEIPYGYCKCGCGQKTNIACQNHTGQGWVKGEPLRYVKGHHFVSDAMYIERFWRKINKLGPNDCWEWALAVNQDGYGRFLYRGKMVMAHVFSWELVNDAIPHGLEICHKCDNPRCVNPNHLFIGTHSDNMKDMYTKGRHPIASLMGETNGFAKLTENQVREVRRRRGNGETGVALAQEYGVATATISLIVNRKIWQHIE